MIILARQQMFVHTFRTLLASQREELAKDWRAARELLLCHRRFLREPHMLLDGEAPIDVALSGELGGQVVEEILGRLAYGSVV